MIRDFDRFLRVYSDKEELVYFSWNFWRIITTYCSRELNEESLYNTSLLVDTKNNIFCPLRFDKWHDYWDVRLIGWFVRFVTQIWFNMIISCTRCASGCVVECRICNREVADSNLSLGYFAPRSTQPPSPPGSVNEYQLRLGRQRQVWLIPIADEHVGVQVKLWNPLRTRAIPERFCGGDSLRRGAISSVCTFTTTSSSNNNFMRWLQLRFDFDSTAVRPRYDLLYDRKPACCCTAA